MPTTYPVSLTFPDTITPKNKLQANMIVDTMVSNFGVDVVGDTGVVISMEVPTVDEGPNDLTDVLLESIVDLTGAQLVYMDDYIPEDEWLFEEAV